MRGVNSFRKINEKSLVWFFMGKVNIVKYAINPPKYLIMKIPCKRNRLLLCQQCMYRLRWKFNGKFLIITSKWLWQLDYDHAWKSIGENKLEDKRANFSVSCYKITHIKPSAVSPSLCNRLLSISVCHFTALNIKRNGNVILWSQYNQTRWI